MGAWSTKIFDNDISMDILTEYKKLLGYGLEPEDVYRKISEYYAKDFVGQDDEDDYWLAIAYFQWKNGILLDEVKENAIRCLNDESFLDRWRESGKKVYENRKKTVEEFKYNLLNITNPTKKKFPKCPAYLRSKTPYKVGDVILYKVTYVLKVSNGYGYILNSDGDLSIRIKESGKNLYGKYILFKVMDIKKEPVSLLCPEIDYTSSAVLALYDWVGDYVPTMEEVSGLQLRYFIDRARWIKYDFDTMTELKEPYLAKEIYSGFDLYEDAQFGDKELNEFRVIGNDGSHREEYDSFRKEHPGVIGFYAQMGIELLYSFANYDGLKYDPVLDGR